MGFAKAERAALCEAALAVGPAAPTLCEGWDTADLVAHVWTRENDVLALPGVVLPPFEGLTAERNRRALQRWGFLGLVELVRHGPPRGSVFSLPGVDEQANTVEFFVHTEDVRRPNALPSRPRSAAFEDMAWRRAVGVARMAFRDAGVGIVLERDSGECARVRRGASTVTLVGAASELLLYVFGRTAHADVQLVGTDAAVTAVRRGHSAF